jgi:hypothetical protein
MSETKRNTPAIRDDGFGGKGGVSNTAYQEVTEYADTPPAETGVYGDRWQEEADAANAAVDAQDGIER